MKREIKPYKQNGPTCAIACMMMTLFSNGIIDDYSKEEEMRLYDMYKSKVLGGTPFSALALHLGKNGLKTELYHSEKNYFSNNERLIPEDSFNKALEEYKTYIKEAKEYGLEVYNGVDINTKLLKEKLDQDNLIILAGMCEDFLHAVLLCGYDEEGFYLYDPLYNEKKHRSYDLIEFYMTTDIGKWFLTVKN